jgi:hypothetical protein
VQSAVLVGHKQKLSAQFPRFEFEALDHVSHPLTTFLPLIRKSRKTPSRVEKKPFWTQLTLSFLIEPNADGNC